MRPTLVLGLRRTLPLPLRPTLRARAGAATGDGGLARGARRDPELIPLGLIMMGIFGLAGYFGGIKIWSRGTESEQESEKVLLGKWQGAYIREVEHGVKGTESRAAEEYRHFHSTHPDDSRTRTGTTSRTRVRGSGDIPSTLHSTVIRDVSLPKELHDKYNKWGKDEYQDY